MALIVEDGTGKPDANTYAGADFVIAYAQARGVTVDAGEAEKLILDAMDYIESFRRRWKGERNTREQGLTWPRHDAVVDGFVIPSDVIPKELQSAVAAAVVEQVNGFELQPSADQWAVRVEKVDVITVQYAAGGGGQSASANAPMKPTFPKIDALLNPLLIGDGGLFLVAVRG